MSRLLSTALTGVGPALKGHLQLLCQRERHSTFYALPLHWRHPVEQAAQGQCSAAISKVSACQLSVPAYVAAAGYMLKTLEVAAQIDLADSA